MRRLASFCLAAVCIHIAACSKEQGHDYTCSCTFLTDFDDGSSIDVSVCAPSVERVESIARGCAQSAAPAPVDTCACKLERTEPPCAIGACTLKHREQ